MCGILGFGGPQGSALVDRLVGDLAHRGPDDEGRWVTPELALGHRRLSIIGLDQAGRQPMISRSGRSVITYNGEIYNYLEIAEELEGLGRPCDRRFDTSVLIEALEQWGIAALPRLNGMFALAWYRPAEKRLLLVRDRWGKKPLFWGSFRSSEGGSHLAFSSELRTFTRLLGGAPEPDPLGIARYLVYDGMAGERTVYRSVQKVAAASWLEVDPGGKELERGVYWRFEPRITSIGPREAEERFVACLSHSLDLRLRSDVPVGLFLSGGIDSSLLAALWRRKHPGDTIRTFTVGFENPSYDERDSARLMARAIGSEHHEILVSGDELERGLTTVLDHLPEPLADPSLVPTSLLSRFAREHVTVAIGGDGGDELQAGYDPFRAWDPARLATRVVPGRLLDRALGLLERLVPADPSNMSLQFKLHHFRQGLPHADDERIQGWLASFPVKRVLSVLKPELAAEVEEEEILEPTRRAFRALASVSTLHAQINTWIATYLECCILAKVDRASMMHSLEVRAPYLDPAVAESLTSLPLSMIFRRGRGKVLLRQAAPELLPRKLLSKPKKGLGVPLTPWLRTVLRERLEEAISRCKSEGWFDQRAIESMRDDHFAGRFDHRKALWSFVSAAAFQSSV